jgi:hypothetical protein
MARSPLRDRARRRRLAWFARLINNGKRLLMALRLTITLLRKTAGQHRDECTPVKGLIT